MVTSSLLIIELCIRPLVFFLFEIVYGFNPLTPMDLIPLPFVEFSYNRTVHLTIGFFRFEIVYGFNPLTPMDLIPLPFEERVSLDGEKKAKMVRQLHKGVWLQIEKKNRLYASKANKGHKLIVFQPGDYVWVHMRKE